MRKLIPSFLLSWYHYLLAVLAAIIYGFPSRNIIVIGVTGTSGKSTVVDLTTKILEEAGHKVAALSSLYFKVGEDSWENKLKMTMPGRLKLQKFIRKAVNYGCKYAVLEVTSEGIKQHRHRFINFNTAVFTNLTPEHIEAHGSFEKYKKAKLELFQKARTAHIVNLDDEHAKDFLRYPAKKKYLYKITNQKSRLRQSFGGQAIINIKNQKSKIIEAESITIDTNGIQFEVQQVLFKLNLLGEFNIYNALSAICVGLSQGIALETSKTALEKAGGVPGRMEVIIKKPFTVVVDYAHTPAALKEIYKTSQNYLSVPSSSMICVLGSCGGGRDKWKRPVLGKLAAQYCQKIIITNEDPYDENPMEIIEKVAEGAQGKAKKILDRREAIKESLKEARQGDVVVITGKGSEPWMCVEGGKKIAWDDRQIVRVEFQKIQPGGK